MQEKSKKNILIISPVYPFPQKCGFTYRVGDMCKYLALYFNLHLLLTDSLIPNINLQKDEIFRQIHTYKTKKFLPIPLTALKNKIFLKVFSPHFDDPFYENRNIGELIKQLCCEYRFSATIINTPGLGYCMKYLPENVLKIIDAHDIWHQKYLNYKAVGCGQLLSQFRDKKREIKLYKSSDITIAISLSDLEYMRANGIHNAIHVPPSFVLNKLEDIKRDSPVLLYTSGQGPLNIDAVEYFIEKIFPLVKSKLQTAKFKILNPSTTLTEKYSQCDNIIFANYTDDLKNEYQSSDLVVVPLRFANGIKIKVLESFAFGKATIVSPPAIQGINSANFAQRKISIEPEIFAEEVINAVQDQNYRKNLVASEEKIIKDFYSPQEAYKELLETLLNSF